MKKLFEITDKELAEKAADHVLRYRGISESTRLLEELLKRFLKTKMADKNDNP